MSEETFCMNCYEIRNEAFNECHVCHSKTEKVEISYMIFDGRYGEEKSDRSICMDAGAFNEPYTLKQAIKECKERDDGSVVVRSVNGILDNDPIELRR